MSVRTLMTVCSLVTMFGLAFGSASIAAQDATPITGVEVLPPDVEVAGTSLAEWSALPLSGFAPAPSGCLARLHAKNSVRWEDPTAVGPDVTLFRARPRDLVLCGLGLRRRTRIR